ncbi:unnamed protein product [Oncorhynchus mykiss]|uniref:Uncharacterized protein n=1 Tax=Oncorhynchus mykiss TaxID=8022 RepID=A0A060ZAV1_ONCMY|nr:unnamed protein product [Oncorhynchus mykiss]
MKQAIWLLGVLCLQVCLLSTTAFSDQTDEQQPYKPTKPWTSAIQDLHTRRCQKKALNIVKDSSHPSHRLFYLLSHGKRYRCSKSGTNRALNSVYPQAIRPLNTVKLQLVPRAFITEHQQRLLDSLSLIHTAFAQ